MIEQLDNLQKKADSFKAEEGRVLGIFVYSISFILRTWEFNVKQLMKNRGFEGSVGRFTLTTSGEPISLREYCCRLANNNSVQVVLLEDSNESTQIDSDDFILPSVNTKN